MVMTRTAYILLLPLLSLLSSCGSASSTSADTAGDTVTTRSDLLTLVDADGYTVATVKNPWDTTAILATYILAPRDMSADSEALLPKGTVIRVPLERSVVYSGVHGGAVSELGGIDAIAAVADGEYFTLPAIKERIASGRVRDVGNSMSPSIEAIVELSPDAILTSPYNNTGHGAIEALGVPIIEMADYMESTPLGRAEWIKLIGRLYGAAEAADSIYDEVVSAYEGLKGKVAACVDSPMVITEQPAGGVWTLPGGRSYAAALLNDAGGRYPWSDNESAGSIELDAAAVLDKAEGADVWFIRSYGPLTQAQLRGNFPLAARFKAVANGGVYVCDTSVSPLFDEFPFHPERLLRDYIIILHRDVMAGEPRYFRPMM